MGRWAPDAAGRLHAAAVELFVEQGYAETTVPQIAARAGLTTRSFFRHFADKREVLFLGEEDLPAVVRQVFAESEPSLPHLDVIVFGLRTVVAPRIEQLRPELRARSIIMKSDGDLRERGLRKLAILHDATVEAFLRRGASPLESEVAARLAVLVYDTALNRWLDDDATTFADAVDEVVRTTISITGPDR
jgi:AcrR family transcriptional regulator